MLEILGSLLLLLYYLWMLLLFLVSIGMVVFLFTKEVIILIKKVIKKAIK